MLRMIVDGSVINRVRTILTKERIRGSNHLLLDGCSSEKGLKKGTGFKDIGDGPIPPTLGPVLVELVWIEKGARGHG